MGVIKNLMVRIGADVSGYLSGMKTAARTTASTGKTISSTLNSTKKNVKDSFSLTEMSIRDYTAAIAKAKEDHAVATQGVERLEDKLDQLRSVYDTVKSATEGLDLSKPLADLAMDAEKSLTQIEAKRVKLEKELTLLGETSKGRSSSKYSTIKSELNALAQKSKFAQARLADLNRIMDAVGEENLAYASTAGMQELLNQITSAENELRTMETVAEESAERVRYMGSASGIWEYVKVDLAEVGNALKYIGASATQAAAGGIKKLWSGLKSIASGAVKGIASLPSKLKNIGNSASGSSGGLEKMVRSVRNLGLASLGMRVAQGLFGRLRSIISSYVSENDALNNSVSTLKTQLGEALAPAINLVIAAMQKLMPLVTAVSSGINSILTALLGDVATATSAVSSAVSEANSLNIYGFDQITKASESGSSSGSSTTSGKTEARTSALVQKLTNWIQKLKEAFVAGDWAKLGQLVGDGINSAIDAINAVDVGEKIGKFFDNFVTTAYNILATIDFTGIGSKLGQMFTSAIDQVDWNQAGNAIGLFLTALPSLAVGFILGTDWKIVGTAIRDTLSSAFSTVTRWLQSVDWLEIGQAAEDLLTSIDWNDIVGKMFEFLGAAIGALVGTVWGAIDTAVLSIRDYFSSHIEAAGGDVALGLLNGILEGLGNIGNWIKDNVITPFVAGFSGLSNGVVDVIEGMVNTVIDGINKLIKGLNKVLDLGDAIGLNFNIQTISHVSLPRAATGTVVSKATDLTVGEDGTEAVVPLERHTEWLDVLAEKLVAKTSGSGSSGTPVILQIFLGNRKITEYTIKDINQITREKGICPIRI